MAIAGKWCTCCDVVCANNVLIIVCRVNTFGSKIKVTENVYHAVHEYHDTLKNIYLDEFQCSVEFQDFVAKTGKTSVSFGKFLEGALSCPCIKAPVMRVCVDEVETAFNEVVKTLNNVRKKNRTQRKPECLCVFCVNEAAKKEQLDEGGKQWHTLLFNIIVLLVCLSCSTCYCSQSIFIPYPVV